MEHIVLIIQNCYLTFAPAMEKAKQQSGKALPVMEHFYTIQGEGMHSGTAAYFIRLAGCDVGCHWCDVKESWDANMHSEMKVELIVKNTKQSKAPIAVITGGEPAMYDLTELTKALKKAGRKVHMETSGAYPIKGTFDWICVSPKKRKPPVKQAIAKANELKVVIYNKDDISWAEKNAALVSKKCKLLLQPEWSKADKVMPMVVEYVKAHPKWQISLQSHKYMQIP
jgi:organic radical activating enzyme